jgi:hypothetical protein
LLFGSMQNLNTPRVSALQHTKRAQTNTLVRAFERLSEEHAVALQLMRRNTRAHRAQQQLTMVVCLFMKRLLRVASAPPVLRHVAGMCVVLAVQRALCTERTDMQRIPGKRTRGNYATPLRLLMQRVLAASERRRVGGAVASIETAALTRLSREAINATVAAAPEIVQTSPYHCALCALRAVLDKHDTHGVTEFGPAVVAAARYPYDAPHTHCAVTALASAVSLLDARLVDAAPGKVTPWVL